MMKYLVLALCLMAVVFATEESSTKQKRGLAYAAGLGYPGVYGGYGYPGYYGYGGLGYGLGYNALGYHGLGYHGLGYGHRIIY
ncbi:cuticle protein 6.4-like [Schistocerca americana]|uniref:cuticle protein 6.4-like n=1 Tax=Schistocerca americana TaxID=7009 RepID=UPI001F4F8838|nr:cuticle protein 6.4-like [Schistocerca americana]